MRIRNWQQFQHFKDRTPPWVKLYRDLLDDPDWNALDGHSAKVLTMLWLVASEDKTMQGQLPELNRLAFRLRMTPAEVSRALQNLSPWVELEQPDIEVISARYRLDAPETETETETEAPLPMAPACTLSPEASPRQARGKPEARPVERDKASSGGTRFPADMDLTEAWIEEAQRVRPDLSRETVRNIFEGFRDYWLSKPGKDGRKSDWLATWRNWIRREKPRAEEAKEKEDWI